jgi:membrane protease YdiL (CAAX protease family)
MIQRKPLIWFLAISFGFSWVFFTIPLAVRSMGAVYAQAALGLWAVAMWGPGLAAIITTLLVEKQPFSSLRLNKLGKARYYVAAWLLPPLMAFLAVGLSAVIGTGELDPDFTTIQQILGAAAPGTAINPGIYIAIQMAQGLLIGPLINILLAMGEELGWRGFLLPRLLPAGQWRAILISGVIWGVWHAPVILQGYNYPQHPVLGVLLMTVSTVLLAVIFSWLYLKTRSPWAPALGHASLNAWGGLPILFLVPGFDTAYGGIIISVTGWVVLAAVIGVLVLTRQLPVRMQEEQATAVVPAAD